MFITIFDVETNEITYINKNVINLIGIDIEHYIAEIVVGGVRPHDKTIVLGRSDFSDVGQNSFHSGAVGRYSLVVPF